jgi:hypothetical protein
LPFGLLAARAHARIWAELAATGQDVGAHDRLFAATAITAGWRVGKANMRHFDRIDSLDILAFAFAESRVLTAARGGNCEARRHAVWPALLASGPQRSSRQCA